MSKLKGTAGAILDFERLIEKRRPSRWSRHLRSTPFPETVPARTAISRRSLGRSSKILNFNPQKHEKLVENLWKSANNFL